MLGGNRQRIVVSGRRSSVRQSAGSPGEKSTLSAAALRSAAFSLVAVATWGAAGSNALAQSGEADIKTVRVVRTATPPVIDGDLSDAVWANAAVVDDLHQTQPIEFAEPYEHTEILILYDDEALYVAARLHDTPPGRITANNMRQNDNISQDDSFYVTIDPFNEQRSGYFFGLNANGVRADGLYRNVTEFYADWDSIFDVAAGTFENGWTAEIEIPFKSISFDPTTDTWGLNFSRSVRRKDEVIAWVSRNRQYNPSVAGRAVGFEGLQQGVGLDVIASAAARTVRTHSDPPLVPDFSDSEFEPSLDLVYKLTPQLNASVTVNTDFSATEVDDRQVNLDRFGLFFPEKRDFFLREADIFEFGGIGGQRQSFIPGFNALAQNARPFFSRRMGLSADGSPVDLEVGGKISGRVGRFQIGAVSVRQDAYSFRTTRVPDPDDIDPNTGLPVRAPVTVNVDADNLSIMRARAGLGDLSTVGVIFTEGNPSANLENSVAGFDYLYHNTQLPGGRVLDAEVWYQQSDTDGIDDEQSAFGIAMRIPSNEGLRGRLEYREVEANFNPALGFINRRNVSDAYAGLGYMKRMRQGFLQSWLINLDVQQIDFLDDGSKQTHAYFLRPMVLRNRSGDQLTIAYQQLQERLRDAFAITPGVAIPIGEYEIENWGLQFSTADHRNFAVSMRFVNYTSAGFYGGDRDDSFVDFTWRPSPRVRANLSYEISDIDLPLANGSFETRLVRAGLDFAFTSTISLVNLVQYDNITETAGLNMRLHWIPEAGRELYFVVNHNVQDLDRDNNFHTTFSDMTAKINYTFRF